MATLIALLAMAAQRSGTAHFDRSHDAPLRGRQRVVISLAKRFSVAAKDVRYFQPRPRHGLGFSAAVRKARAADRAG